VKTNLRRHASTLLSAALILLSAAPLSAGRFVPADAPAAAVGHYRVSLDTTRVEDVDATVTQLLSICRCRIEPYAEEGFTGFLIAATPSAARMLSSDPRVSLIEEIAPEAPTPAGAVPPLAVTGAAPTASPTEPVAATAIPHIPVANAGVTAWDTGSYTYDASGNIRAIGSSQIYTYDPYGRLAYGKVDAASRFHRYSYDRYGNLSSIVTTDNGQTSTTSLSISGLTNRLSSNGAVYDAAGRLTSTTGTGLSFRYDGDGMPTWSQMPSGSLTQTKVQIYSATDERIGSMWISPANGSDWTLRDASGQVLRRLHKSTSGQWSWQEDYVYRDGQMLAAEVATREKTLHYHLDHLGTPRLITGNGGAQVSLHTYDPFGGEVTSAAQAGTEAIKKFTGHERDTATVDYMHARYYQNGWGRFLSVDPGKDWEPAKPQSWNLYAYARNNPITWSDPNGRAVTIEITRDTYTQSSVTSTLSVTSDVKNTGTFEGFTLETTTAGDNGDKDPIPAGDYTAFVRKDHDPKRVELQDVPGFEAVQIHVGNTSDDVKGCFAAGKSREADKVNSSKDAMSAILKIIEDDGSGAITVKVVGESKKVEKEKEKKK
jgi:RHS repeat-associated protein